MKPLRNIVATLTLAFFLLAACGGSSPEAVALKLMEAQQRGDYRAIKELLTKKSADMLSKFIEVLYNGDTSAFKAHFIGKPTSSIRLVSATLGEDGNTATVIIELMQDGASSTEDVMMVKENGEWKAEMLPNL